MTTVQIREVIERLVDAGQWQPGDPEVLVPRPPPLRPRATLAGVGLIAVRAGPAAGRLHGRLLISAFRGLDLCREG